jgi:hypothetical protein
MGHNRAVDTNVTLSDDQILKMSSLERYFVTRWRQLAPTYIPEPQHNFRFAPPRRYHLDFAWLHGKIALECQGAIWIGGRHVRGNGYENDLRKHNLAVSMGWTLFYLTTGMLESEAELQIGYIVGELDPLPFTDMELEEPKIQVKSIRGKRGIVVVESGG